MPEIEDIEAERALLTREVDLTLAEFSKALEAKDEAVKALAEFESEYGEGDA